MKNDMILPLIMGRLFNVPLMIHEPKLNVILVALRHRLGLNIPESMADDAPEKYKLSAAVRREGKETGGIPGNIAVIPVHDTLVHRHTMMNSQSGMTSYMYIRSAFRRAMADDDISGVILHFDTPGGEVTGCGELSQEIFAARGRKPIYAAVEGEAFSAGYYLASAADRIFLTESSGAGSIGVIIKHIDQSGYDAAEGIKVTTLYAGARKNDFSPHGPLTEEAQQVGIELINYHYNNFVQAIARNRNISEEAVRGTEAALYWGEKAVTAGLADEIGGMDEAITAILAASAANTGAKNIITKGVHPERKSEMENFQTLEELEAAYPGMAAQLREQGRASVNMDEATTGAAQAERERILGLAAIQFGAETANKFGEIIKSGITVEQYQAVAAVNPPQAEQETAETKRMGELLTAIQTQTGKETPGMGTDAALFAMAEGPEKWRREYEQDARLSSEFKAAEHYIAYKKGVAEGRVKILGKSLQ